MARTTSALCTAALLAFAAPVGAPLAAQPPAQPPAAGAPLGGRPALDRLAALVQQRLSLDDAQAARLRDATRKYATQREQLLRGERGARQALRGQLQLREKANQSEVARLLDELLQLQRQRVDLVAQEQKELASFLSPVQRAEFLGMQERAFRAAQQARLRREQAARGVPPRVAPPGDGR